ncbi:MAG: hypothetical protein AB7P20_15365 [Rhizobiaceae bacterium]
MASQWGRGGLPLLEANAGARLVSRSLRCALAAAALVVIAIAAFIALRPQAAPDADGLASILLGVAYFLVAPILLVAGIGFGIAGLRHGSGGRGLLAIGLNILLLTVGGLVAVVSVYLA